MSQESQFCLSKKKRWEDGGHFSFIPADALQLRGYLKGQTTFPTSLPFEFPSLHPIVAFILFLGISPPPQDERGMVFCCAQESSAVQNKQKTLTYLGISIMVLFSLAKNAMDHLKANEIQ